MPPKRKASAKKKTPKKAKVPTVTVWYADVTHHYDYKEQFNRSDKLTVMSKRMMDRMLGRFHGVDKNAVYDPKQVRWVYNGQEVDASATFDEVFKNIHEDGEFTCFTEELIEVNRLICYFVNWFVERYHPSQRGYSELCLPMGPRSFVYSGSIYRRMGDNGRSRFFRMWRQMAVQWENAGRRNYAGRSRSQMWRYSIWCHGKEELGKAHSAHSGFEQNRPKTALLAIKSFRVPFK